MKNNIEKRIIVIGRKNQNETGGITTAKHRKEME